MRKDLIQKYSEGYKALLDAVYEVSAEMWDWKPAENKWSVREIVIHVADAEVNGYLRLRKALAESGSSVTVYDQDAWVNGLKYSEMKMDDHLELFRLLRKINTALLRSMDDIDFVKHINHPERGMLTIDEWLQTYVEHIDVHVNQIIRNNSEWGNK